MPRPGYSALSVTALIGLVTLTSDLTSKQVHWLPVWWASILPILGFLGLSVLELGRGTQQQTDSELSSFLTAH